MSINFHIGLVGQAEDFAEDSEDWEERMEAVIFVQM